MPQPSPPSPTCPSHPPSTPSSMRARTSKPPSPPCSRGRSKGNTDMLFVLICRDKPGHLETRLATRDAHVAYLKGVGDRLKLGGPLLSNDDEGKMEGSILLIEAESLKAAQLFAENDPYATA